MILIKNKCTDYHICYSKDADECVRFASGELQKYLYKSTGVCIPLFSDKCNRRGREIHIGCARGNDYKVYLDSSIYSDEAFMIKKVNDDLVIIGNSSRGTLYGVYYFLDKYIGFRCLANDTEVYNKKDEIEVTEDEIKDFPFEHRDVYWSCAFDGNFASKNYLNSNLADLSIRKGGKRKWYNFHHSFGDLISPNEYFDSHPEYFSLIDGKRIKEHTELCLSNDEVYEIVYKKVKEWIMQNPDCDVFSVAQDEWMGHFERMACECDNCKKIDEKYQSQSGSIITFVNRLARQLKEDGYNDKLIHTFAYQYSRKPPVDLIPLDNIIVRLTNIECSWDKSLEEGSRDKTSRNALFLKDLINWSKICKRLYIWDYAVNYRNYLLPFPCIRSMYKNINLYKRIGVKGLLMEGNFSHGGGGYFDELKSYITSRLMSFDNRELDEIIKEFCDGYYGKASPYCIEYLNLFEDAVASSNSELWLYDDADSKMFTDELVEKAKVIINKALEILDKDSLYYKHVMVLYLSYMYMYIVRKPIEDKDRNNEIDEFFNLISKYGITELFERTSIEFSKEVIKKSRYAKDREGWYSLYYIMK